MRVVPRYRDLFGKPATLDQLMDIVRSYPVFAWLSFLSRLQTLLGPPHETDNERHRAAFAGLIGPEVGKRLVDFEKHHQPHGSCLTFVEPQIATLQQIAILHAPESGDSDFVVPGDFDQLATALLITWELMEIEPAPKGRDAVTAALAQAVLRNSFASTPSLASRAYHAYRIGERDVSDSVAELRQNFETAAGVPLADYILGGLTLLILEESQSPEEIAAGWTPRAPVPPKQDPVVGEPVEAFCRVRCTTLKNLRAEIQKHDGERPIHEFSLIALSRYPLIEFAGRGRFIASVARVADALFEGVRHTIQTARLEGDCRIPVLSGIGKTFGLVFEEFVQQILDEAFGDRLVRLPRSNKTKRADGLIVYPNRLVVYEIKSKHPRAAGRHGPRTIEEREQELVDIGVGDAAEQIADTINELRGGNLDELLPTQYDWTTTRIVPVVITAETVPLVWNMWHRFEALAQPIAALPMQDQISRIRLLDIADVERLPDLVQVADASAVFLEWANNPETFERPLLRHLNVAELELSNSFLQRRYGTVMKLLADRHGLDASKLDFLEDEST
ncbi:MAG: hypothetical protein O7D91_03150 [Planctomycetota bacterium]|nr:hypothetical protein [Planctomycetota bacterium]